MFIFHLRIVSLGSHYVNEKCSFSFYFLRIAFIVFSFVFVLK